MPVLQREWGDDVKETAQETSVMTGVVHEAEVLNAKHNDVSATQNYKTKLKIEARKKEEERKKKHMQTIHNTVSKKYNKRPMAVASYSVKLANERLLGHSENSKSA